MTEDWVSIREASDIIGRTERTIRRWVSDDKIAHRKEHGRIQVDVSDFRRTADVVLDAASPEVQLSILRTELDAARDTITRQDRTIDQLEGQVDFLQGLLTNLERPAIDAPERPKSSWWDRLLGRS